MDLPTLFALPDPVQSQAKTVEDVSQTYTSWDDLNLDQLEASIALHERSVNQLESKLGDSMVETPLYTHKASDQTNALLKQAQHISLSRHELSDLVASLREQAEVSDPSSSITDKGQTLLEQIEGLVREEREAWVAVEYLGLVERVLRFRENILAPVSSPLSVLPTYRMFLAFSLQLQAELPPQVSFGKLAAEVVAQTWTRLKQTLSENLIEASKAISWPLKLTSPPSLPAQTAFEEAFLTLLSFQQQGHQIHGRLEKAEPLYPFEALIEPIRQRWRFHFESSRPTNRLDKPEWAFTHLLNLIHELEEEIVDILGGLLRKGGVDEPDPLSLFITHLLPLPESFLIARIPHLLPPCHPSLLAHTIHQALVFDDQIRMIGYNPVEQDSKAGRSNAWGGLAGVVLGRRDWFDAWLEGEEEFSRTEFQRILQSSNAFKYLAPSEIELDEDEDEDGNGGVIRSDDQWGAIWSSVELTKLIGQITNRYSPLPSPTHKLTFLLTIQTPLLHTYLTTLSGILDAVDRLTSTFARVIPGALAGHAGASGLGLGLEVDGFKGKRGLEKVVEVLIGARWVRKVLRKWGDELFFVDLLAEIVDDPYLRSKATDLIPSLSSSINVDEHTLFDEPVNRFDALFSRAEDVMVRHICLEVESELKPHLTRRWDISSSSATTTTASDDPLSLPPTLIGPLRILSTHLTYLSTRLPPTTLSSIYRRVVSHLTTHLTHRTIFGGWSKFTCLGGRALRRELDGWIDTSKAALGGKVKRPEGPWRRLTDIARVLSIPSDEGNDADADADEDDGFAEEITGKDGERITLSVVKDTLARESDEGLRDRLGLVELDKREVIEVLRRRIDWSI
ncbi:ER to golgi transport protein/RAD50-interacting protein 1 [Phaffia rhodozyma]|uniref:ER to golgi transport protein/RAD50-interacting protein 1 n=1 Tax=Phaffia rhodozyma TaxID=264483 RepID=A0A0F7SSE0_PHARH|nr:ER to golgi transport protein/RAD50-interacting protein 1 [Phaffia rhodozyma]